MKRKDADYPHFKPDADDPSLTVEDKRERMYEAIRNAQAFMHKRVSPDGMMQTIRTQFPTPQFFVEANRFTLTEAGLPRLDAFYYTLIPRLARTAMCQAQGLRPKLDRASLMATYIKALFIGIHEECFYLIMLDGTGKLIHTALLQKGSTSSAPFYLRPVLATTIRENAKFIVLAHNHPRGTLRPSKEDLLCTLKTLNAVTPLGVPMLDHMIYARGRIVSIRETGLIPDLLWTAVAPWRKVVREWLDVDLMREDDDKT